MSPNPPPHIDEATWRNRFITINLTRIGGTLIVLFGLFVWHSDWLRPGGWMTLGLGLAIAGLIVSFWGPIALARKWRTPPKP